MARDRGPPVLRQPPGPPRPPAALPAESRGWGWLGAGLWPALVVGLLAALVAWLWYGSGDGRGEESGGEAAGEAPRARGEAEGTEDLLASGEQVLQQAKAAALSSPREAGEDAPQHNHAESSRAARGAPEREQLLPKPCAAASEPHAGEHPADVCDGQAGQPKPQVGQNIHVTFRVHYITHSDAQLIGVTGDHECLGQWHSYVPLKYDKDGFWSESVVLPVDTKVEWKFILVENGKVTRWEECGNRTLVTEHEDRIAHQWWGHH
uniref:Starch-binding domain-containing protein 1 n=1 Tax=Anser brachyrhynchus TaxID=132585 RepID=A0A8B9C8A5_9AVES